MRLYYQLVSVSPLSRIEWNFLLLLAPRAWNILMPQIAIGLNRVSCLKR